MTTEIDTRQTIITCVPAGLLEELQGMIDSARQSIATTVNAGMTMLYWRLGNRIRKEVLKDERANYGKEIVATVSRQLAREFGQGFAEKSLRRMLQFSELFPDEQIVATLSRQLSWSHFVELMPIKDSLARDFYAELCRIERWNVRTLRQKVASMLYERTAISKKPELTVQSELESLRNEDRLTPGLVFRDPYVLEFLNLTDRYLEKDLEDAIMRELEQFLLELGSGFTFVARQKRIVVDDEDFYIDLLFFHRDLRRLVAIELKLGDFKPEHKGQMEFYLRWLDRHERRPDENTPLGLILCAGKKQERIELLELDRAGIHVAEYLTMLPSKEVLAHKLQKAIKHAQQRLEANKEAGR